MTKPLIALQLGMIRSFVGFHLGCMALSSVLLTNGNRLNYQFHRLHVSRVLNNPLSIRIFHSLSFFTACTPFVTSIYATVAQKKRALKCTSHCSIHIMHPNSHVTNIPFANTHIKKTNPFAIMRIDLFALRRERVTKKKYSRKNLIV